MLSDRRLIEIATELTQVPGMIGVALGGSRARGEEHPDSDVDLGLYYRAPLDIEALQVLAQELSSDRSGGQAEVTETGGWGPWVDGGGWLSVDGVAVDWIYRDVDRVARSVEDALGGRIGLEFQVGHPFGFSSVAYAGELALGVLLADPKGELSRLRSRLDPYPPALVRATEACLWEADFLLGSVAKSARRADTTTVAGCLFRVVLWCTHVVAARAGRWVINEKGAVDAAGTLPGAPDGFAAQAHGVLAELSRDPERLSAAVDAAKQLVATVRGS